MFRVVCPTQKQSFIFIFCLQHLDCYSRFQKLSWKFLFMCFHQRTRTRRRSSVGHRGSFPIQTCIEDPFSPAPLIVHLRIKRNRMQRGKFVNLGIFFICIVMFTAAVTINSVYQRSRKMLTVRALQYSGVLNFGVQFSHCP